MQEWEGEEREEEKQNKKIRFDMTQKVLKHILLDDYCLLNY